VTDQTKFATVESPFTTSPAKLFHAWVAQPRNPEQEFWCWTTWWEAGTPKIGVSLVETFASPSITTEGRFSVASWYGWSGSKVPLTPPVELSNMPASNA
jgi:hypothetical protein